MARFSGRHSKVFKVRFRFYDRERNKSFTRVGSGNNSHACLKAVFGKNRTIRKRYKLGAIVMSGYDYLNTSFYRY